MKKTLEIRVCDTFEVATEASYSDAFMTAPIRVWHIQNVGISTSMVFTVGMYALPPTNRSVREDVFNVFEAG